MPAEATAPTVKGDPVPAGAQKPGNGSKAGAPQSQAPAATQNPANKAATQPNPRTQQLIDQAEAAYRSGVENYNRNRLDDARHDFDRAVDMMLTSGLDLKNDPVLSEAFEHLVDEVNAIEMTALKQGNGFSPKMEPTPVEVANDVTFPVDPNIRAQAEAELKTTVSDLPLVMNDPVASFINFFSTEGRGRGTMVNTLQRAGRYKAMITKVLAEEGVPQDLIYQAVAESGFQPQAVNHRSGAAGMWQFMPFDSYGLTRNGWYDERFDPVKSTHAYARYIKDLYNQFGDWYLAMAAYDWGPGNVQRAVQRTGYADFWELYRRNVLPTETKNYVPIILAATIMAKNPAQYGLSISPESPLVSDTVTTNTAVDLRLVADVVERPLDEIINLNPSLLRMSTPRDMPFELHLPAGTAGLFNTRIAQIPEDRRATWRYHKVVDGDTLEGLARTFHVSAAEIASVNQLQPDDDLSDEDALIIPAAPVVTAAYHASRYRTRGGDTVVRVADRFGITPDQLRRWNSLSGNALRAGRVLAVSEPAHLAPRIRGAGRSRRSRSSRSRRSYSHTAGRRNARHSGSHSGAAKRLASGHPAGKKRR